MSSNSETEALTAAEMEAMDERFLDLINYKNEQNGDGNEPESEFSDSASISTYSTTSTNLLDDEELDEDKSVRQSESDQFKEEESEDQEAHQGEQNQFEEPEKEADDKENYDKDNIPLINPSFLLHLPKEDVIEFDMTCGACAEYSGPPQYCCTTGHSLCTPCYELLETTTCLTQMKDLDDSEEEDLYACGAEVSTISDSVKNSAHFKDYLENSVFTCGAWSLGCQKLELKYDEIEKHESEECFFRSLRYCQFRSIGCYKSFVRFEEHLYHLIEDHGIPVSEVKGGGHFLVPYDRKEYKEDKETVHHGIIPIIRGVILLDDNLLCLLMAKEVVVEEEDMTRIWVCYVGSLRKEEYLEATICLTSSARDEDLKLFATEIRLRVLQAINTAPGVDSFVAFTDVSNKFLDKEMIVNAVGHKFVNMMICVMKIRKDDIEQEGGEGEAETGEEGNDEEEDEGEGQPQTGEETEGEEHEDLWSFVV